MFNHILLPTDGSELSESAIRQGIRLAESLKARVTGLAVMPVQHAFSGEVVMPSEAIDAAEHRCREVATGYLSVIERTAQEAGVHCELVYETSDHPYEVIIRTAEHQKCDLIMMASHGRKGFTALLLGSETQKVLTHTKIPVLVSR